MIAEAIDGEIVDLLIAFMELFKGHFASVLEQLDLSMSQGHVLMCLHDPTPMSAIAKRMGFDASHITALVDRLEERGLIERRPDPRDRRVKRITITDAGAAVQSQIRNHVRDGLATLTRLTETQRRQLRDLLATATDRPAEGHGTCPGGSSDRDTELAAKG